MKVNISEKRLNTNEMDLVTVNMNGTRFEMRSLIFSQMLASASFVSSALLKFDKEYFFDRNVASFRAILEYFQHGELHLPENVCPNVFHAEVKFWGVDDVRMAECCHRKMTSFQDDQQLLKIFNRDASPRTNDIPPTSSCFMPRFKWNLWCILDKPNSSRIAKGYLAISIIFVIISLFVMAASTHSAFMRELDSDEFEDYYKYQFGKPPPPGMKPPPLVRIRRDITPRGTNGVLSPRQQTTDTIKEFSGPPPIDMYKEVEGNGEEESIVTNLHARIDILDYLEYAAMAFFTVELLIRLFVCPSKCDYFKNVVNICDIIALTAMYVQVLVNWFMPSEKFTISLVDFIECLQTARVFRFFRIVKDVIGFRVLIYTIRISTKELCLLIMYLILCVVLFAGVVFFCERDNMKSIPDAMWWVVITMTTVGYGDIYPVSYPGKVVGCLVAICGVLLIAVTIPVFVNNFILFYNYSKTMECDKINTKQKKVRVKSIKIRPISSDC